ncbi:MAG: hypothetical protein P8047_16000 [Gammaproteobacteria bacterium]
MTHSNLQASDIWLLLAVQYSSGAGTKEKIVEAGDFINHAIFTDEEFNGGIKRLLETGYIKEGNNKYSVTNKFKSYWNNGISNKQNVYNQLNAFEEILLK